MFIVCNNYDKLVSVAFMWYTPNCPDGGNFTKKGWYNINPGQCGNIFNENLTDLNAYYYLYAYSTDNEWRGDIIRNVPTNIAFESCEFVTYSQSRNIGFGQIDTGDNIDFTINLTA